MPLHKHGHNHFKSQLLLFPVPEITATLITLSEHWSRTDLCAEPSFSPLTLHEFTTTHSTNSIVKFGDETIVLGLIKNND